MKSYPTVTYSVWFEIQTARWDKWMEIKIAYSLFSEALKHKNFTKNKYKVLSRSHPNPELFFISFLEIRTPIHKYLGQFEHLSGCSMIANHLEPKSKNMIHSNLEVESLNVGHIFNVDKQIVRGRPWIM